MSDLLTAGLFTVAGACIGAFAMWIVQMKLRKEKFKEIIYKKKFAVYQHIAEGMDVMATILAGRIPWDKNPALKVVYGPEEQEELRKKNAKLGELLGGSLLVSAQAKKEVNNLRAMFIEFVQILVKYDLNEVSREDVLAEVPVFNKKYLAAINTMRKELHIEAIQEAIFKTF